MASKICDHMSPEDNCVICLKQKIGEMILRYVDDYQLYVVGDESPRASAIRSEERERCARLVERERLQLDGSHGITPETDYIATRIIDHLAAKIRKEDPAREAYAKAVGAKLKEERAKK